MRQLLVERLLEIHRPAGGSSAAARSCESRAPRPASRRSDRAGTGPPRAPRAAPPCPRTPGRCRGRWCRWRSARARARAPGRAARARAGSADSAARCAAARTPARPAPSACGSRASSASSDSTTPLPMKQRTCSRRMPEGISDRMVFLPPMTSVWPALCPPWKRATAAARSVSRSTTLPLPSSPHWVPMMMTNFPTMTPSAPGRGSRRRPACCRGPRCATRDRGTLAARRAKARFTPCGFRNGAMPSSTRNSAERGQQVGQVDGHAALQQGANDARAAAFAASFRYLKNSPSGRHHQQIAVLAERALVGLQAAVEGVELRILA